MKLFKLAIVTVAFLGASTVFASTVESSFFWQAKADSNTVTPEIDFITATTKADTAGAVDQKFSGPVLKVSYERGFNQMLSAGITLGYATQSFDDGVDSTDNIDIKGMNDVDLFLKGNHSFAEGFSLHYGAHLLTSIGNNEQEVDSAGKVTVTANTGGSTVTPFVGYTMLMGSNVLGAQASFDIVKTERTTTSKNTLGETDSKEEGEAELKAGVFFEMPFSSGMVGYSVGYLSTGEGKDVDSGNVSTESSSYLELMVYPTWQATPDTAVVGAIAYRNLLSQDNVDSASEFAINVGGRFMF